MVENLTMAEAFIKSIIESDKKYQLVKGNPYVEASMHLYKEVQRLREQIT